MIYNRFVRSLHNAPKHKFKPFGGFSQLNSSTLTFKSFVKTDHQPLSSTELARIANLSYLQAPTTDEEVKKVNDSIGNFIVWLSQITNIDTSTLSNSSQGANKEITSPTPNTVLTPFRVSNFSPLPTLMKCVSKDNIVSNNVSIPNNLLRHREDVVNEGNIANILMANAKNSDRGYFVVPSSMDGEE